MKSTDEYFISDLTLVKMPYLPEITKATLNLFFGIRVSEPFSIERDDKKMGYTIKVGGRLA